MPTEDEKPSLVSYAAIQQPAPLQQDGNMAANWREWKSSLDYYLIASGKDTATEKEKCALFLHIIGKYGREILDELDISDAEKNKYATLCQKFKDYFDPRKNINFERHVFFETYQNDCNFDKFLGILKIKSNSCEFGALKNSLILTQLIRGLKNVHMKEKLLAKTALTLEEATQWCRAQEQAGRQATGLPSGRAGASEASGEGATQASVERLSSAAGSGRARAAAERGWQPRGQQRQQRGRGAVRNWQSRRSQSSFVRYNRCDKCAYEQNANEKCPAYSVKCFRCEKFGHFAKCCRIKLVQEIDGEDDTDFEGGGEDFNNENGELLMYNISIDATNDSSCKSWSENINVNGVDIRFKLDSGADASVMSFDCYTKSGFDKNKLIKCSTVLREISKKKLPVIGYFDALLKYQNNNIMHRIYVLNVNCNNLLGLKACVHLKLISRVDQLSINNINIDESIFVGIGCLPTECNIQIDESVLPVVHATRKIPIKLRCRLRAELENMEELGIIKKEEGPTDWVSSIVVVEKPNKSLRVCLDPKSLNVAVKRSHFQLPTLEEVSSNLSGAKYFSKCDAKNGFWMLKLNEKSSKLCTFATPYGRYRFLRMPFGINCAPEIFHREMYNIFRMDGVEIYIDDILIWGSTKRQHDERLAEVMRRAKENGVKFNKDKCVFGVEEITFLGHTFNGNGMKPDKTRVKAITWMPTPADKKELERFLGVTNYLSRFIPRYSDISAPLRELLGKNVQFEWLHTHEKAFQELKERISNAPVLKYYSPKESVTVSVDASSRGLGACLLQGGRPVAYAARTLTPTEMRWAQIEKELLAVTFGCTRFHQYIYGHKKVTVENDHKPLETIFKKSLNETPARLQRLMLKLQHYNIDLQYKPGKMLFIADTLSRAAVEAGTEEDIGNDVMVHVNTLYENVEATPEMLSTIKAETEKDPVLQALCEYYKNGWPVNKKETDNIVKPFWNVHNELHVINGILFRNERVVMPMSLRGEMLRRIHEGHMGIEKCQRRARDVMWWPGMSADIARVVESCETCQRHRAANPREPLSPHPVPEYPWEVLAADIFEFKSKQYLLVVDYFSKYVEVAPLPSLHSASTILALKTIFGRFGIPKRMVTDNGTQFSSEEFKNFSKLWEFEHVTSSPHYPRSNGLAERNVRTVKSLLLKSLESGEDWQLALLNFRNTPITGEEYSPAQLLMGRRLNTRLPVHKKYLQPQKVNIEKAKQDRHARIQTYKKNYDKGTRQLVPLQPEDNVKVKQNGIWVNSKILNKARAERSYWVATEDGGIYRRNRQHLLRTPDHAKKCGTSTNKGVNIDWENLNGSTSNQLDAPHTSSHYTPPAPPPAPPGARAPGTPPHMITGSDTDHNVVTRSGRVVQPPKRYGEWV